jgi:hypothetical protein
MVHLFNIGHGPEGGTCKQVSRFLVDRFTVNFHFRSKIHPLIRLLLGFATKHSFSTNYYWYQSLSIKHDIPVVNCIELSMAGHRWHCRGNNSVVRTWSEFLRTTFKKSEERRERNVFILFQKYISQHAFVCKFYLICASLSLTCINHKSCSLTCERLVAYVGCLSGL